MSSMSSSKRHQQECVKQMRLIEKLTLPKNMITGVANGFAAIFTGLLRGKDSRPPEYYKYIHYSFLRTMIRLMSPAQFQTICPSTDDIYASACKKHNLPPNSEVLEDGTCAHWIGPSSAEKIIINFHGGGYVLPAGPGFMEFMFRLYSSLATSRKDVAILFLSYDLAPTAHYPRQLQQAAALLSHVLHVLHKKPQNIILTGDSAGGNLALSLLSHISHPHPSTEIPIVPINLNAPLRGLVLISPWVDFRTTLRSFTENSHKDYIDKEGLARWRIAWLGTPPPHSNLDNYNQALTASPEWWEGVKVEEILILAGTDEVTLDGIEEFTGNLKKVKSLEGKVQFFVSKGEAHDGVNMDLEMGYKSEGENARRVREYVISRL